MRGELLAGVSAIWLGVVYLADAILLGSLAATTPAFTELLIGTLFILTGVWVLRDIRAQTTQEEYEAGLPDLLWYLIAGALIIVAIGRTAELFGFI